MSKKRVLLLGKLPPPYMGPSIGTVIMLQSALNNDFKLFHLDTKANYTLQTLGRWSFYKLFKNIGIYFNLIKTLIKDKPDIVLIPLSQKTLGFLKDSVFFILAGLFRKKIVIHFLGGQFAHWLKDSSILTRAYVTRIMKLADGAIVLGGNLKHQFEEYFDDNQIFVIPNGADYTMPAPDLKTDDCIGIIYVSNITTNKGIEDVLQAMVILKNTTKKEVKLTVVGSWRDEETQQRCMIRIKEHNIPVTFLPQGVANEVKLRQLANASIFVFVPREIEGQPWVIIEAMAAGLPIISTDSGAITEAVKEGENGFIVPMQAPQQIAEKINYLIDHPDIRKKMGEQNRKVYLENYTEEKMVGKLKNCFNQLLAT